MTPAEMARDAAFGQRWLSGHQLLVEHQLRVENLLRATAEDGKRAVRRHPPDRLVVVEVVAVLADVGVVLVLAVEQLGLEQALLPQPLTQLADQRGVFGPAL